MFRMTVPDHFRQVDNLNSCDHCKCFGDDGEGRPFCKKYKFLILKYSKSVFLYTCNNFQYKLKHMFEPSIRKLIKNKFPEIRDEDYIITWVKFNGKNN